MVNLEGQNTGDPLENRETKIRRHTSSFGQAIISPASLAASAPAVWREPSMCCILNEPHFTSSSGIRHRRVCWKLK